MDSVINIVQMPWTSASKTFYELLGVKDSVDDNAQVASKADDAWVAMRRKTQGVRTSNGLSSKDVDTDVTKKKIWCNKYKWNDLIYQICL